MFRDVRPRGLRPATVTRVRIATAAVAAGLVLGALSGCSAGSSPEPSGQSSTTTDGVTFQEMLEDDTVREALEAAKEQFVQVEVAGDGQSGTYTHDSGTYRVGADVDVPQGFPSLVPTPQGVTLVSSRATEGSFSLSYRADDPNVATDAYTARLDGAGFAKTAEFDTGEIRSRSYVGEGYTIAIVAGQDMSGVGFVNLSVTPVATAPSPIPAVPGAGDAQP